MNHIFISYSRREEAIVTSLAEALRARGFEVWQDRAGKRSGIPFSVKWKDAIDEAIFTALGAVIVKSEAWMQSEPCDQEFQTIKQTALPYLEILPDRLVADEQAVVNEVSEWFQERLNDKDNGYRSWMLSGAYRVFKGLPIDGYTLGGKGVIRRLLWLKEAFRVRNQLNFYGPWMHGLGLFAEKTWNRLRLDIALRALAVVFVLAVGLWGLFVSSYTKKAQASNEISYSVSANASILRRISAYDPVRAVREASNAAETLDGYIQSHKRDSKIRGILHYEQDRILSELLSWNYPIEFYGSAAVCSVAFSDTYRMQENSRYTVSLSEDTAQVFIYDRELDTTRQLLLAAVPEVYCFNETGDRLLLAAENKIYVYDLLGQAPPSLLSYNFESVRELYCVEDRVYAITEAGHILVWDDPLPVRDIRRTVTAGALAQTEDGSMIAVYADDGCLIRNTGNREDVYPLSFADTVASEPIAVSPDGACVAVVFRQDGSETDNVAVVALSDGALLKTYETGYAILDCAFSPDGTSLLITCGSGNKIVRIDLEKDKVTETKENPNARPFFNILPCEDRVLACDTMGNLAVYDYKLKQQGGFIVIGDVVQKQLAFSQPYNCVLTAARGGYTIYGFRRTMLSDGSQAVFTAADGEEMISTTSVAVTSDGFYAAYGNAGGSIYIWDVGAVEPVWNEHCIPEGIVNMRFSDDSTTLYVLGSSGTVYEVDVSFIPTECMPMVPISVWQMHMGKASDLIVNMYHLGLVAEDVAK